MKKILKASGGQTPSVDRAVHRLPVFLMKSFGILKEKIYQIYSRPTKERCGKQTARFTAGQIMLESIVAISIIVIALLGIFDLLSRSLSTNRIAGNQYVASNLASEGIEVVKNLIDNNAVQGTAWNAGLNPGIYEITYDSADLNIINQIDSNPDNCAPENIRQSKSAQLLTFDPATGLYAYGLPNPTIYKRAICIKNLSENDELKVNSIVTWTTRGDANFEINLEGHYFNWR